MNRNRIELRTGDLVFREGDPPTSAFLIDSGCIAIYARTGEGELELGRLGAGDLLGEMGVLDSSPRTASAKALSDAVLIAIDAEQLNERLDAADPVVRALLRGQLQRYRSALSALRGVADASANQSAAVEAEARAEDADAIDKIRLETQLRDALARGDLEVRFQPLLEIESGRIAGYEALIRWDHPTRGAVSPAEFIRLAEETSLIVPVGYHVFAEVARTLARLADVAAGAPPFIAVNVSARQLEEPEFLAEVVAIATAAKAPLAAIKIEVTESLTLDVERVGTLIGRAHELGMTVALDDFGTGFSNLGHLHRLHFDTVKLDQGFVRQMLDHPRVHAIVQAIATMVAALDADMVAEGVETDAQLDALRAIGCRYAQGWLIGRPLDLDAVIAQQRAR
jgi:EAL domain-containing protein (putative c-di-GMP-specific phosphodiesterase class I)